MAHSSPHPQHPPSPSEPLRLAQNRFAAELRHWRELRRLPKKQLASKMGYDPSYVSHIEGGHLHPTEGMQMAAFDMADVGGVEGGHLHPTEGFARRAETVLGAGG